MCHPSSAIPSSQQALAQQKDQTYAILFNSLLLESVLVSYVSALGAKLLCEVRALGEGAIGVAVWVLLEVASVVEQPCHS